MDILEPDRQTYQPKRNNSYPRNNGLIMSMVMKLFGSKNMTPEKARNILVIIVVIAISATVYTLVIRPFLNRPQGIQGIKSHDIPLPSTR